MIGKLRFLSLGLAFALFVAVSACRDEKPTRSECIIGYALDWTGVNADPHDAIEALSRLRTEHKKSLRLASMTISRDGTRLYLGVQGTQYLIHLNSEFGGHNT